jgi:hypothetical protein
MRRTIALLVGAASVIAFVAGLVFVKAQARQQPTHQQQGQAPVAVSRFPPLIPAKPLYNLEDAFLRWPLPVSEQAYASIDGLHLKEYVKDLVAISRRSRDRGEKLWGRIIGTQSDTETEQWLLGKFKHVGLSNVHSQPLGLPPQWYPQAWEVTATSNGNTLRLDTAQPTAGETAPGGFDAEAVWVGLGTVADFAGRDVRGKAVFIHAVPLPSVWRHSATVYGAVDRALERGSAAIITIIALPGNIRTQRGVTRAGRVPVFSMGLQDGEAVRQLIEQAPEGRPPRVRIRIEGKEVAGLTSANVWGELPGMTDERIIIFAHRDGYFDAASDNASGVATTIGLAEYFATVPKEKRRRTIQFIGTPGHHGNVGLRGARWLLENKDTALTKTALLINAEHTAAVQSYVYGYGPNGGPMIRKSNTAQAFWWYAGGSPRFQQIVLKAFDTFGVATYEEPDPWAQGEMGEIYQFAPSVQLIEANMFYHSDHETLETVPATGLEQSTRAYAKIVDDINKVDLRDLISRASTSARR